ncbi:MAG TPA: TlpA disulfide reductase family protein [Methylophilaceae bacterium]|nr:TlpA disulfide reductase family protein [Methylophilaceae bacterium]
MKKKFHWILLVIAIFGIGVALLKNEVSIAKSLASESPEARYFFSKNFPNAQGKIQPLEQWQGKIIIANFWATWCSPCREEMPELSQIHSKYLNRGVMVLGIATDDSGKINEYAKNKPISYPLLAGEIDAMNLSGVLGNNKGVVPYTVIINRNGQIVRTYFGRINSAAIDKDVSELLKEQPQ